VVIRCGVEGEISGRVIGPPIGPFGGDSGPLGRAKKALLLGFWGVPPIGCRPPYTASYSQTKVGSFSDNFEDGTRHKARNCALERDPQQGARGAAFSTRLCIPL
jgi:hypothetical protein